MGEIILFQDNSGKLNLNVKLDNETVWLSQQQMVELFGVDKSGISRHLKNIFDSNELVMNSVVAKFATTASDGKSYQVEHYNLDVILSVGYRVNSKRAMDFRQWATNVLKDHLVRGFTLNQNRLEFVGVKEVQDSLEMLARTLNRQPELSEESRQIIHLIDRYAKTWTTLFQYDEGTLRIPTGTPPAQVIDYAETIREIQVLKRTLVEKREAGTLFGQERGTAFEAIIGNVEQEVFGEPCYKSVEEKAANLLYFIVKDHPFSDGNKRIGSFMFLRYLEQQGVSHDFGPGALPALTLLIAESSPTNKETMVRIAINAIGDSNVAAKFDHGPDPAKRVRTESPSPEIPKPGL